MNIASIPKSSRTLSLPANTKKLNLLNSLSPKPSPSNELLHSFTQLPIFLAERAKMQFTTFALVALSVASSFAAPIIEARADTEVLSNAISAVAGARSAIDSQLAIISAFFYHFFPLLLFLLPAKILALSPPLTMIPTNTTTTTQRTWSRTPSTRTSTRPS